MLAHCENCGKPYRTYPAFLKRGRFARFCSSDCLNAYKARLRKIMDLTKPRKGVKPFWSFTKIDPDSRCWEWQGKRSAHGYGHFSLVVDGQAHRYAHRVAFALSRGPLPEGMFVCHSCDNPSCVNPEHLFLGTPIENIRDRDAKGRSSRAERHPRPWARLNESAVRVIRARLAAGERAASLARDYGVTASSIWSLKTGKSWRWVTGEEAS